MKFYSIVIIVVQCLSTAERRRRILACCLLNVTGTRPRCLPPASALLPRRLAQSPDVSGRHHPAGQTALPERVQQSPEGTGGRRDVTVAAGASRRVVQSHQHAAVPLRTAV